MMNSLRMPYLPQLPVLALICLVGLPAGTHASQWLIDGEPAPPDPSQASAEGLGIWLRMTTDSQTLMANWERATPGVELPDAEQAQRGQPIEAMVFFAGCHGNEQNLCELTADYRIMAPDGSIYAQYTDTEVWMHKPVLAKHQIGLAIDRVGLIAEAHDPLGLYAVQIRVTDIVSGVVLFARAEFEIVESP